MGKCPEKAVESRMIRANQMALELVQRSRVCLAGGLSGDEARALSVLVIKIYDELKEIDAKSATPVEK